MTFIGPLTSRETQAQASPSTRPGPPHGSTIQVGGVCVRVVYDPDFPKFGESGWAYDDEGCTRYIKLREWNERVFLHELLHILLTRRFPSGHRTYDGVWVENADHEYAVQEIEDGLWDLGWRWATQ